MPKKGKFKHQRSVNPQPAVVKDANVSSQSIVAPPRKISVAGSSSTVNEQRIAQRVAFHRSAISDVKRSLFIGAIMFVILAAIYLILAYTHMGGIM